MKKNLPRKGKGIAFNVSMLYIMNIAKLVFPLITLPYLTRVLSVDCYGVVSYVKATMVYAQLVVDFGFMLSGVKAITEAREDRELVGRITGNVILAKVMLSIASLAVIVTAALFIPILRENMLYTILAFIPIALSTLLLEFLFRGLELMHIIAARYVLMKSISVGLTLVLVKGDSDILWIPILDILSSLVAIILTLREVRKLRIQISFVESIKGSWNSLKVSSIYFVSEAATTVFGALNTILVGCCLLGSLSAAGVRCPSHVYSDQQWDLSADDQNERSKHHQTRCKDFSAAGRCRLSDRCAFRRADLSDRR